MSGEQEQEQGIGWAIVELLGHVRLAGRVSEEEHFGAKLGRLDIPTGAGFTTQFFGGSAVYRLTPVTEEIARAVAERNQPEPVSRWELPARATAPPPGALYRTDPFVEDDEEDDGLTQADLDGVPFR
jgi:hypothetical protein